MRLIKRLTQKIMGKYLLKDTPQGIKTLIYIDSLERRLHSAYDPIKEAERSVNTFDKGRANLIIICGLGLGYHVKLIRDRFPDCFIVVIERHKEVIDIAKKTYPENLEDSFIVNTTNELPALFEEIDISIISGVVTYYHRPSFVLFSDFYENFLKNINEYITSKISDLLTRFEFEERWVQNMLRNSHLIYTSSPVKSLFGKFKDYPGIIVSAGPSLRKNVAKLNDLKNRALIVCVDTAFKVLQRHNVTPHIVMTLDSQRYSQKHFLGLKDHDPVLIADIVSCPRVIESYDGTKLISTTTKFYSDKNGNFKRETTPLWDWIEQFTGSIGDIQSGGSVATSVFDLLLNLGCRSIILIGQDLAYTGREIHCTGTYHNDEWLPQTTRYRNLETINQNIIRKRKIKYVDAYNGEGLVISDFVFDLYRNWFGDSASKVTIPVINATGGGARIANTEERSMDELLESLEHKDKSPDEIISDIMRDNVISNPAAFYDGITQAISSLNEIKRISEEEIEKDTFQNHRISQMISDDNISKIIRPLMRKTYVYLSRHPDMDDKSVAKFLTKDIFIASNKMLDLLEMCKTNIEKIGVT